MNKSRNFWFYLTILFILAIVIFSGANLLVHAEESSPAEQVQNAWNNALESGSYRYISDTTQAIIPRPIPEMIGEQETVFDLAMDGVVVLPNKSYLAMKVLSGSHSDLVVVLRDGEQSYMLIDGELKPVQNSLNLASQSNDLLGYLAAADEVTLLDPPEGHPDLVRYGFLIEGPQYAEYVRQKAEENLRGEPGAPQSLTVEPIKALQNLSGQGELWVNSDGFPVRQVLDLELPEVNDQYSAKIRMISDFSAFGKVESLPRAVQSSDGNWQLQGTLQTGELSNLGEFPGFGQLPAQAIASQPENSNPISSLWSQFKSLLPIKVSPTGLIIFIMILLLVIIVRYYHRDPRRCYMLIIFVLIPIMVFSPLLETTGMLQFFERQAQAARDSAAALPDLLHALGFDIQGEITGSVNENPDDNILTSQAVDDSLTDNTVSSDQPDYVPLYLNEENDPVDRCGDGEPGVDSDSDGLPDTLELCLGTNPNLEDTDQDGISDRDESEGFEYPVGSGKFWTSDPLNPDSNGDGLIDTIEWPTTFTRDGQTVTTLGQADNEDFDKDGIPNIWDDDNDNDDVPDAQDLSAFAVTGFTTLATLSTQLNSASAYEIIEIQVQPQDLDHLRYATTPLDWPDDDNKGNVQDLDESKEDLRLVPFLIVSANVEPKQSLADKYGFRSWLNSDGKYILMAPLAPVQEMGAVHSYYAKIAYAPGQTQDIQWDAQMVWMAEVQTDHNENFITKTETRTLHQYQDSFRITGMQVTKDEGYEAAVIATPYQVDDLYLFKLLLGLNNYVNFLNMPGQLPEETALNAMAREYTSGTFPGMDVPGDEVVVAGPVTYGHMDEALGKLGSEVIPDLLQGETYSQYYENGRCNDAEGNIVNCASLILAYELKVGVSDLSNQPLNTTGVIDPTQLSVNLAEVPLLTTRGRQMNMYEQSVSGWQMTTAARMLELMEQRYKDNYSTAMRVLYPNLSIDDVRFITYAAYLWATNPGYNPISIDEQILVPEQPTAEDLADDWLTVEEKDEAKDAISFWGIGTGIAFAIGLAASSLTQVGAKISAIRSAYYEAVFKEGGARVNRFSSVGAGLLAISAAASLVMGIINSICAADFRTRNVPE